METEIFAMLLLLLASSHLALDRREPANYYASSYVVALVWHHVDRKLDTVRLIDQAKIE